MFFSLLSALAHAEPEGIHAPKLLSVVETEKASFQPEILITGLDHPWGMDFLPDGRMLITERSGNLRVVESLENGNHLVSKPVDGLPEIWVGGQGGLLDVAWHQGWVYISYAEPGDIPFTNSTAVSRGQLKRTQSGNYQLTPVQKIFTQAPKYLSRAHFGSRLVFDNDGHLFITLGERYLARDDAQTLDNHHGKIVRLNLDGSIPADNPFVDKPNAQPEIWSLGHRNIQGAWFEKSTGQLWIHEHGPKGGDELNRVQPGKNYGWPVITYGEEYSGGNIGEGTHKAGMEQPIHYWVPSITPSGMAFFTNMDSENSSSGFADWQNNLLVGSLKFRQLVRLVLKNGRITNEERIQLPEINQRIRDISLDSNNNLYLLTDADEGTLVRLNSM